MQRACLQLEQLEDRLVLSLATVASFDSLPQGTHPAGGLVRDASGNLFGTTTSDGAGGHGVVFKVAAASGAVSTVASFDTYHGSEFVGPLFVDGHGNLFGTSPGGIFEVAAGSGTVTTLAEFNGSIGAGGSSVSGLIQDHLGNFFGATSYGGDSRYGAVFELPAGSSTIKVRASFTGFNGAYPYGGLVEDSQGKLFGTT
jgi:uncharacterized repeat protein (TIGR03803 family)